MMRRTEECERTQLFVVWTEEREKKKEEGEEKLGLPQPICQLLFFNGLKVKTELTTDFLYLPSYIFLPQVGLEGPVIHSHPCSFFWLCFRPAFSAFASACSQYPSFYLTVT